MSDNRAPADPAAFVAEMLTAERARRLELFEIAQERCSTPAGGAPYARAIRAHATAGAIDDRVAEYLIGFFSSIACRDVERVDPASILIQHQLDEVEASYGGDDDDDDDDEPLPKDWAGRIDVEELLARRLRDPRAQRCDELEEAQAARNIELDNEVLVAWGEGAFAAAMTQAEGLYADRSMEGQQLFFDGKPGSRSLDE
jgi:hypothetical protein